MTDQRLLSLYIPVQQAIINYWMGELPIQQTAILLYINERTLRYGKPSEHINRSHFLSSVTDKHGHVLHNGIKIAHTSLWKFIRELEELFLVRVTHMPRSRKGNIYELNMQIVMAPVLDGKLKTSSKSKGATRRKRRFSVANSPDVGVNTPN